jgi:hypothetical protein
MSGNTSSEKLSLVIYDLLVSFSVIILLMDLLNAKTCQKNYPFHFIGISIDEYNISPTEKLYIIPW